MQTLRAIQAFAHEQLLLQRVLVRGYGQASIINATQPFYGAVSSASYSTGMSPVPHVVRTHPPDRVQHSTQPCKQIAHTSP